MEPWGRPEHVCQLDWHTSFEKVNGAQWEETEPENLCSTLEAVAQLHRQKSMPEELAELGSLAAIQVPCISRPGLKSGQL